MGKRSNYKRKERDYYPTPDSAMSVLLPHLPKRYTFVEPCAGDGRMARYFEWRGGECLAQYDIEPRGDGIEKLDALHITKEHVSGADFIITNPPWDRTKASGYLLHELIVRFSKIAPTWLLFDADWMHTKQSGLYMRDLCLKVVSVGRVKWIEDSNSTGKDNCAWYLFYHNKVGPTVFVGR